MKNSIVNTDRVKAMEALAEQQELHWPLAAFEIIHHRKKKSHWMWFIFPQLASLGRSSRSKFYEFRSKDEISLFLKPRERDVLIKLTEIVIDAYNDDSFDSTITGREFISKLFHGIDYLKFLSCMTLFYLFSNEFKDEELHIVCQRAIDIFYAGILDEKTVSIYKELK